MAFVTRRVHRFTLLLFRHNIHASFCTTPLTEECVVVHEKNTALTALRGT
jgi:hypothetical protein